MSIRTAAELLKHYAEYHRDRRNIATHLLGVPLVVLALGMLLARPSFVVAGWLLSPAWLLWLAVAAWYLTRGELLLGLVTSMGIALLLGLAQWLGPAALLAGLVCSALLLLSGVMVQLVGHYYEGRGPAFADEPSGLLVGPMFVALEVLSAIGLCQRLAREVERHAGPTLLRDLAHPA